MLGLAVGTAAGYVMNDRYGDNPANADNGTMTTANVSAAGAGTGADTTVAPIAARIDPVVERFAWDSTCAVALTGLGGADGSATATALGVAVDQATLFEPGIVPADVATALADGHEQLSVVQRGGAAVSGASVDAVRISVESACSGWTARIDAG